MKYYELNPSLTSYKAEFKFNKTTAKGTITEVFLNEKAIMIHFDTPLKNKNGEFQEEAIFKLGKLKETEGALQFVTVLDERDAEQVEKERAEAKAKVQVPLKDKLLRTLDIEFPQDAQIFQIRLQDSHCSNIRKDFNNQIVKQEGICLQIPTNPTKANRCYVYMILNQDKEIRYDIYFKSEWNDKKAKQLVSNTKTFKVGLDADSVRDFFWRSMNLWKY